MSDPVHGTGAHRALLFGAVALGALLAGATPAQPQESGFQRAEWTDPAPSGDVRGTPLAYLDRARPLTGVAVHSNGIARVTALLVPDLTDPAPEGCEGSVDLNATLGGDGTFRVAASFPCNRVYEIRANAQSNPGTGFAAPPAETRAIPLLVAAAIPPAPVAEVEAEVKERTVTLTWPGNTEPDLLGYVVTRDGESIGQVNAGDTTRLVDDDPPAAGGEISYEVVAYRRGPTVDVEQVTSSPTAVRAEVPADPDAPAGDGTGEPDPQLAGEQQAAPPSGAPLADGLSSVRGRGQAPLRLGTATTLDTGFQDTLPFDTSAGGDVAASPAGDSAVVAVIDETEDVLDDKQRLAFIAGGLAVLTGAAVIMHVTRRAAREAY